MVRSVVKGGPAAVSIRPPVPGDALVKVDGFDVRGLGLDRLRPWLVGAEGSVVSLSFERRNLRYDTSVVRASTGLSVLGDASSMSARMSSMQRSRSPADLSDEQWRQSALYNPASSEGRSSPDFEDDYEQDYEAGASNRTSYRPTHGNSSPYYNRESLGRGWPPSPTGGSPAGRRAAQSSWAAEADKILGEAQAKIEEALQRERLLQETLDMLRERNAVRVMT